jgi:DNA mismatch endonuclease (patch repair protein)
MGKWRDSGPDDAAWRCPPGLTRAARMTEQDRAAGGHANRMVSATEGLAVASVALRRKRDGRRIYAYLRWSDLGHTVERYIGEVDRPTRAANLGQAWRLVIDKDLPGTSAKTKAQPPGSWASSPAVRAVMRANKGRDTRPELAVRSAAHALGLRYRVGVRPVPGVRRSADLVFPKAKVAVFVDGCFWHGCPQHHRPAKRNVEFWRAKIEGNVARDADTDRRLEEAGWRVVRVLEHEEPAVAAAVIAAAVRGGRRKGSLTAKSEGDRVRPTAN